MDREEEERERERGVHERRKKEILFHLQPKLEELRTERDRQMDRQVEKEMYREKDTEGERERGREKETCVHERRRKEILLHLYGPLAITTLRSKSFNG